LLFRFSFSTRFVVFVVVVVVVVVVIVRFARVLRLSKQEKKKNVSEEQTETRVLITILIEF
jgi:membrane protein implicated in regulation of membrane protease activity